MDGEHGEKSVEGEREKEMKGKESGEDKTQTKKEVEEADQKEEDDKLKVLADKDHSLLLIVKWGGELTTMGIEQALELGRAFRY